MENANKVSRCLGLWFGEHCVRLTYSPSNMLGWRTARFPSHKFPGGFSAPAV